MHAVHRAILVGWDPSCRLDILIKPPGKYIGYIIQALSNINKYANPLLSINIPFIVQSPPYSWRILS